MSLTALAAYTFKSRYAKYNPEKRRRETWGEITERVFDMHAEKFKDLIDTNEEFRKMFEFSKQMVKDKKVLGSQRSLQFAGEPIKRHNSKLYNCSATNIDRPDVFKEILYLLLSGCGVGFSVQKRHVSSLPFIGPKNKNVSSTKVVHIGDSIEGWAEAVDELMDFYFVTGHNYNSFAKIEFDYSLIRPKGAKITGGFKAPGPEPLKRSIEIISNILDKVAEEGGRQLRPIEVYDIIMHLADAVISGGVRRSACITLFDYDDEEMLKSKSEPFWWENNPQRTRSNNSVIFNRKEVTREQFDTVTQYVKNFGEPGFVFVDNYDVCVNPCCLRGDTLITTDKGDISIQEITERFLNGEKFNILSFNVDNNSNEFKPLVNALKTKENTNVIKLNLENDKSIVLTPDHRVLTKNGYKTAASLTITDEIISL